MRLPQLVALYVILLFILFVLSESTPDQPKGPLYWPNAATAHRKYWDRIAEKNLKSKLEYYKPMLKAKPPKNVILFIGDGMGMTSVTIARRFKSQLNSNSINLNEPLSFEKFRHSGLSRTSSFDFHVTDSAAGAMALLSGWKVNQYILGTKPGNNATCENPNGAIKDTIADLAVSKGRSVGLVTTDAVTGATPGAMYAKLVSRSCEHGKYEKSCYKNCPDIAKQILSDPARKFKVILGGGREDFLPRPPKTGNDRKLSCTETKDDLSGFGCRHDGLDIAEMWKGSGDNHFLRTRNDLLEMEHKSGEKVLGLFAKGIMSSYMRERKKKDREEPTLSEMSQKAVEIMEKDNAEGYFMLIEGAQIDKALHGNLAVRSTWELIEFANAIETVRNMTNSDETLILVTADHSHSIAMPGYAEQGMSVLQSFKADNVRLAGMHFATGSNKVSKVEEITKGDLRNEGFRFPAHIYVNPARHGGEDVGIWADGPYSWLFSGSLENTEVAYYMKRLLNLTEDNLITSMRAESGYS